MDNATQLPAYSSEELANLTLPDLMVLMIGDEDRVPRNVIEECARRGDAMTEYLARIVEEGIDWHVDNTSGVWWMRMHIVMILGLIPTEAAGMLIVKLMSRMSRDRDENLQDWLAGRWPVLFRNKPESVHLALRGLCEDRTLDWPIRISAVEAYVSTQHALGDDAFNQSLEWLAGIAADEKENWELRLCAGNDLLHFPRPQYRSLLESLVAKQKGMGGRFCQDDIDQAYKEMRNEPLWERFTKDPWEFYLPQAINARQKRWAKDDTKQEAVRNKENKPEIKGNEPYAREVSKLGRNDPCPCGSGKKYKKCCLGKVEGVA